MATPEPNDAGSVKPTKDLAEKFFDSNDFPFADEVRVEDEMYPEQAEKDLLPRKWDFVHREFGTSWFTIWFLKPKVKEDHAKKQSVDTSEERKKVEMIEMVDPKSAVESKKKMIGEFTDRLQWFFAAFWFFMGTSAAAFTVMWIYVVFVDSQDHERNNILKSVSVIHAVQWIPCFVWIAYKVNNSHPEHKPSGKFVQARLNDGTSDVLIAKDDARKTGYWMGLCLFPVTESENKTTVTFSGNSTEYVIKDVEQTAGAKGAFCKRKLIVGKRDVCVWYLDCEKIGKLESKTMKAGLNLTIQRLQTPSIYKNIADRAKSKRNLMLKNREEQDAKELDGKEETPDERAKSKRNLMLKDREEQDEAKEQDGKEEKSDERKTIMVAFDDPNVTLEENENGWHLGVQAVQAFGGVCVLLAVGSGGLLMLILMAIPFLLLWRTTGLQFVWSWKKGTKADLKKKHWMRGLKQSRTSSQLGLASLRRGPHENSDQDSDYRIKLNPSLLLWSALAYTIHCVFEVIFWRSNPLSIHIAFFALPALKTIFTFFVVNELLRAVYLRIKYAALAVSISERQQQLQLKGTQNNKSKKEAELHIDFLSVLLDCRMRANEYGILYAQALMVSFKLILFVLFEHDSREHATKERHELYFVFIILVDVIDTFIPLVAIRKLDDVMKAMMSKLDSIETRMHFVYSESNLVQNTTVIFLLEIVPLLGSLLNELFALRRT